MVGTTNESHVSPRYGIVISDKFRVDRVLSSDANNVCSWTYPRFPSEWELNDIIHQFHIVPATRYTNAITVKLLLERWAGLSHWRRNAKKNKKNLLIKNDNFRHSIPNFCIERIKDSNKCSFYYSGRTGVQNANTFNFRLGNWFSSRPTINLGENLSDYRSVIIPEFLQTSDKKYFQAFLQRIRQEWSRDSTEKSYRYSSRILRVLLSKAHGTTLWVFPWILAKILHNIFQGFFFKHYTEL